MKERARAKELELKAKDYNATLLTEESKIMMADLSALDPTKRAWFVHVMHEFVFVVVTFSSHELTKPASADLIVVLF
jgi:hypothetical protein